MSRLGWYLLGAVLGFGAGYYWRGAVVWGQVADDLRLIGERMAESNVAASRR